MTADAQVLHFGEPVALAWHETPTQQLAGILLDALAFCPPLYGCSVFGLPGDLVPPYRRWAELGMLDLWRLRRAFRYATNLAIPSLPLDPPPFAPPCLGDLFWDPSRVLQFPDHHGSVTTFSDEAWLFVNGVATNEGVARLNAACLADLFHRPLTVIQNSTDGVLIDLVQCAVGKQWRKATEPAIKAFPVLYDALTDPAKRRVVVIAHSQGTIIAANLLRMLYALVEEAAGARASEHDRIAWRSNRDRLSEIGGMASLELADFDPLSESDLAKLELYCFATCATEMKYFRTGDSGRAPIPRIEHFGNEWDLVARLGMLAPNPKRWEIDIDGPRYVHRGRWGHLLNLHYLFDIADHQQVGYRRGGTGTSVPYRRLSSVGATEEAGEATGSSSPRLFGLVNGGRREEREGQG